MGLQYPYPNPPPPSQGNKLYANGFPLRDLTAAEQAELTTYETAVGDYKKKVKVRYPLNVGYCLGCTLYQLIQLNVCYCS